MKKNIPTPSAAEAEKYLSKWRSNAGLQHYRIQEEMVATLFEDMCPKNTSNGEVIVKVKVLNLFYSTNIRSTTAMAEHIARIKDADKLLKEGNVGVVDKIAKITIKDKDWRFYSFATKYCSHHNPDMYPIYDSNVSRLLLHFNKQDNFYEKPLKAEDLRDYPAFKEVIFKFRKHYCLKKYSLRELDWYLWLLGKKHFS